jgi:hypothetical protein
MQQVITLLELEVKNTNTYVDWVDERLRTGDLQDSTIEFYDNELRGAKQNLAEYQTALRILNLVNARARYVAQAVVYFFRLRKYIASIMGPRFPIQQGEQDVEQASNQ